MNKAIKTILIISIAVFGAGFLAASMALAQTPPVDPNAGNLIVNFINSDGLPSNKLFKVNNFLPGDSKTGKAEVINGTNETKRIATEAINYPKNILGNVPSDDLSRALTIVIRDSSGDLYGGSNPMGVKTLFDFYKNGETYLSNVSGTAGSNVKTYEFEISFPETAGNEWNTEDSDQPPPTTKFDIIVGFQGVEGGVEYCNKNGIQDNGETGIDCGGGGCPACIGGGGGEGGGGGGSSLPPGLTIQYEVEKEVGATTATITWLTSYKSTSRVVYDTATGTFALYSAPNYGYAFSTVEQDNDAPISVNGVTFHTVNIAGLTAGTTYYYRCVSHASPPTISQERSFTTLGEKVEEKVEEKTEEEISPEKIGILEIIKKIPERITKEIKKIAETIIPSGPIAEAEKPSVPEEIEKPVLSEEKPLGKIFATEGFLAAIGALSLNWKLILIIIGITSIGLFILKLNKKQKTKS